MKRIRTTLSYITLLACTLFVCATAASAGNNKFIDVPEKSWYTEAVLRANELGIMNGTSDTTFAPMKPLTRAEYVAILCRLSGGEENLDFSFTDVPEKAWYKKYVGWAEKSGVITGYGNAETFGGNVEITREQLMLMTARYMKYEWVSFEDSKTAVEFKDADKIASWAADGVEVTRKAGLITGDKNGKFNPKDSATRAEIATIVVRYVDALPNARDPMHMKLECITELVECRDGNPALAFGRWITVRQHRPDVIGDQILPQMGLDTDIYQVDMNEGKYDYFKNTYHESTIDQAIHPGDTKLIITQLFIRNTQTGEETKEVTILFNVLYEYRRTDTLNFDVDLDEHVLKAAYDKSTYSTGNIARLAKVFAAAAAGEDLTVGYIGGSLTAGGQTDPNSNWACATTDWLSYKFPNSTVTGVNAAIGGTNSLYGLVRAEKDLLSYDPDIIYIEYSSNDFLGNTTNKSLEALIRTCLTYKDDVAVIIALCHDNNKESRETHLKLAEYYSLPVLDMREGIFIAMELGNFTKDDFTQDGCHPNTWGHQVQGYMSKNFLSVLMDKIDKADKSELTVPAIPDEMIFGDRYMYMDAITYHDDDRIESYGSWKKEILKYEDPDTESGYYVNNAFVCYEKDGNNPLCFTFTGTDMYIFLNSYYNDESKASVTVTLNDGEHVFEFLDAALPYAVFSGLEAKEYKVSITVTDPENSPPAVISSIVVRNAP